MAIRTDFTAGEVLAAADLNDTFGAKANLASPTFTGTPAGPTAASGTNTTQLATTAFVRGAATRASSTAAVETNQSTTSTSFTDLATAGPAVTLTTGTKALVLIKATTYHGTANNSTYVSFTVSGASTVAAVDSKGFSVSSTNAFGVGAGFLITGLTAGSNTFTMKYRGDAGTSNFLQRHISVIDMGS